MCNIPQHTTNMNISKYACSFVSNSISASVPKGKILMLASKLLRKAEFNFQI